MFEMWTKRRRPLGRDAAPFSPAGYSKSLTRQLFTALQRASSRDAGGSFRRTASSRFVTACSDRVFDLPVGNPRAARGTSGGGGPCHPTLVRGRFWPVRETSL